MMTNPIRVLINKIAHMRDRDDPMHGLPLGHREVLMDAIAEARTNYDYRDAIEPTDVAADIVARFVRQYGLDPVALAQYSPGKGERILDNDTLVEYGPRIDALIGRTLDDYRGRWLYELMKHHGCLLHDAKGGARPCRTCTARTDNIVIPVARQALEDMSERLLRDPVLIKDLKALPYDFFLDAPDAGEP